MACIGANGAKADHVDDERAYLRYRSAQFLEEVCLNSEIFNPSIEKTSETAFNGALCVSIVNAHKETVIALGYAGIMQKQMCPPDGHNV